MLTAFIIACVIIVGLIGVIIYFIVREHNFAEIDFRTISLNQTLSETKDKLTKECVSLKNEIKETSSSLSSLKDAYDTTKQSLFDTAKAAADKDYDIYRSNLEKEMDLAVEDWMDIINARRQEIQNMNDILNQKSTALSEIEEKYKARLEAERREDEMKQ